MACVVMDIGESREDVVDGGEAVGLSPVKHRADDTRARLEGRELLSKGEAREFHMHVPLAFASSIKKVFINSLFNDLFNLSYRKDES